MARDDQNTVPNPRWVSPTHLHIFSWVSRICREVQKTTARLAAYDVRIRNELYAQYGEFDSSRRLRELLRSESNVILSEQNELLWR